jgi:hypothetical protein
MLVQSRVKRSEAPAAEDTITSPIIKPTNYSVERQAEIPFAAAKPKFTMPYSDFQATFRAYCEATGETVSETDFAARLGYIIVGDVVEKR